ncbi:MAG: AMIN domain-containing protein [bacterium]|nr:AMIN domain-containing protein [bacterium]
MPARALCALAFLVSATAAPAATLQHVEVLGGDAPVVRLRLDGAVVARSEELPPRDGQPARIVVDLPGTRLAAGVRGAAGAGPLRRVRVGQFDTSTTRVVLDLAAPTTFTLTEDGGVLDIRLASHPPAADAPARTLPKPGAAPYLDYDDADMQPLPTLPGDWRH